MAAYKDEERGTWYVSFHYYDWTGKNKRKLKRGFKTRKEALEWEQHFRMREESNLDMTFGDFWKSYEMDMKPKLKENPVIKAGPLGKGKADEMNFWTKEEYLKFIEAVKDKPVSYYAFQILYWCGLRLGELLALCASDIDTKNKVLHITKSYQRIAGKDVITDPKTPKSKRDVSIPDFLCGELEQYLGMLYGYMPTDRIFQISKSYLHHEMDRGAKAAGVKRIRIHDIRHSSVSLLINMGFTAVAIGNRVGHESADITYRYAHMFPSEQKEMAVMLNEAFVTEQPEKAGEKREGD